MACHLPLMWRSGRSRVPVGVGIRWGGQAHAEFEVLRGVETGSCRTSFPGRVWGGSRSCLLSLCPLVTFPPPVH